METLASSSVPNRLEKVTDKVIRGSFVVTSPGTPFGAHIDKKKKKVVPRSTLENIVRKVLHKRCLGTPSNHENDGFANTKALIFTFPFGAPKLSKIVSNGYPLGSLWVALGAVGDSFRR